MLAGDDRRRQRRRRRRARAGRRDAHVDGGGVTLSPCTSKNTFVAAGLTYILNLCIKHPLATALMLRAQRALRHGSQAGARRLTYGQAADTVLELVSHIFAVKMGEMNQNPSLRSVEWFEISRAHFDFSRPTGRLLEFWFFARLLRRNSQTTINNRLTTQFGQVLKTHEWCKSRVTFEKYEGAKSTFARLSCSLRPGHSAEFARKMGAIVPRLSSQVAS
jgi:hypothetical protein